MQFLLSWITRPLVNEITTESPIFLERTQGDICGRIYPPRGPFRYFMVLIDASTRWSDVSLLSSRNNAFAKLFAQIIKLKNHFHDYTIKALYRTMLVNSYLKLLMIFEMSIGIKVEHLVPHVHSQNGLAESLIKIL